MLKIGQRLWYINKFTGEEEYVIVRELLSDSFEVWYGPTGSHTTIKYSEIGSRVFLKPRAEREFAQKRVKGTEKASAVQSKPKPKTKLQYISTRTGKPVQLKAGGISCRVFPDEQPPAPMEKSCSRCALRKSGECTSLAEKICDDFRAMQVIPKKEQENFPQYGDANAIRRRNRKRFREG